MDNIEQSIHVLVVLDAVHIQCLHINVCMNT